MVWAAVGGGGGCWTAGVGTVRCKNDRVRLRSARKRARRCGGGAAGRKAPCLFSRRITHGNNGPASTHVADGTAAGGGGGALERGTL